MSLAGFFHGKCDLNICLLICFLCADFNKPTSTCCLRIPVAGLCSQIFIRCIEHNQSVFFKFVDENMSIVTRAIYAICKTGIADY